MGAANPPSFFLPLYSFFVISPPHSTAQYSTSPFPPMSLTILNAPTGENIVLDITADSTVGDVSTACGERFGVQPCLAHTMRLRAGDVVLWDDDMKVADVETEDVSYFRYHRELHDADIPCSHAWNCAASRCGRYCGIARCDSRTVSLHDFDTNTTHTLTKHTGRGDVCAIDISHCSLYVITGDQSGVVRVYSTPNFSSPTHQLHGHHGEVNSVSACCGETQPRHLCVSGGDDSKIRLWDLEKGTLLTFLHTHCTAVRHVAARYSDGLLRIASCSASEVKVSTLDQGEWEEAETPFGASVDGCRHVSLSGCAYYVVACTQNGVAVYNREKRCVVARLALRSPRCAVFVPIDPYKMVLASASGGLLMWAWEEGEREGEGGEREGDGEDYIVEVEARTLRTVPGENAWGVDVSACGRYVFAAGAGLQVRTLDWSDVE